MLFCRNMCNVTKQKSSQGDSVIKNNGIGKQEKKVTILSILLELSASDDVAAFKSAIEQDGLNIDEPRSWYCRRIGSKKMSFEDRTPLMVAAMFGNMNMLDYIVESGRADLNRACGSDRATALHCAVAGSATSAFEVVKVLLRFGADANALDVNGNRPIDLITGSSLNLKRKMIELLLKSSCIGEGFVLDDLAIEDLEIVTDLNISTPIERKEYPIDLSLPDIKNGIYGTDEFRMYMFKIKPCSRAYSHDWTECPFVHPGENARRRDPRKYHYSCVPCPEYRKGTCRLGDNCEYAHGIFECWLHPAQYRTRLCKDETNCARRVCFFAHKTEELRPLYASTGSGLPSSGSYSNSFRLKTGLEIDTELLLLDSRRRQLMDEMSGLSSPTTWNTDDVFGALDPVTYSQMQGYLIDATSAQLILSSYPASPLRASTSSFGMNSSARAAAFAKRSQSFVDRGTTTSLFSGISSNTLSTDNFSSSISDWGSPDGKLDWGINKKDQLNKLRKSASFGFRSSESGGSFTAPAASRLAMTEEPDVSWVQSLVKDGPTARTGELDSVQNQYLYMEHEQMVA